MAAPFGDRLGVLRCRLPSNAQGTFRTLALEDNFAAALVSQADGEKVRLLKASTSDSVSTIGTWHISAPQYAHSPTGAPTAIPSGDRDDLVPRAQLVFTLLSLALGGTHAPFINERGNHQAVRDPD